MTKLSQKLDAYSEQPGILLEEIPDYVVDNLIKT